MKYLALRTIDAAIGAVVLVAILEAAQWAHLNLARRT